MDETSRDYLKAIQGQLEQLNNYLKTMFLCVVAVTFTLIAEVWRHW
jgi:hypothetical protein